MGSLRCWGSVPNGTRPTTPTAVPGLSSTVKSVAAGTSHLCTVMVDGTMRCLGKNDQGQPGNDSTVNSNTPVTPIGVANVSHATAHSAGTCAISGLSGELRCWGYMPGNGTARQPVPTVVPGFEEDTASVAQGGGNSHTCAATTSGNVQCWGGNGKNGRFGTGVLEIGTQLSPVDVVSLTNSEQLEAGSGRTCAVTSDNSISCWGYNGGFYTTSGDKAVPTPIDSLQAGATAVTVSDSHACVLMEDHSAKCWGGGIYGQLGNGSKVNSAEPVSVGQ
jgi:Alpha-tubulin suppressor and related RCC1 domain-containing proteins